jgi:hypothetical protein
VKDFRAVFVFHDQATLQKFLDCGREFDAHADAAAKAGEKGGEVVADGVTVYPLTGSQLALQAMLKGTRYWKDAELN